LRCLGCKIAMEKKCFEWRWACHSCSMKDLHKGYGQAWKILAPKFESLCKQYYSRNKTIFPMPNVPKGILYFAKNEVICTRNGENVLDKLCKVWHMRVRKFLICHNFPPTLKRKAHAWIWKHEGFVAVHSNEELST